MIVYVDILFLINFSMDFLSLFFSSRILHKRLRKINIIIASLIGAAFATVQLTQNWSIAVTVILCIAVAMVMVYVSFGDRCLHQLLLSFAMYFFISAALGGVMSVVYGLLNKLLLYLGQDGAFKEKYSSARSFIIIGLTAIISMVLVRIFTSKKDIHTVSLNIKYDGVEYKMCGLCDSGNMLTEPFSGRKVILIGENSALGKKILSMDDIFKKYIPYKDVSSSGLLKGIIPSRVTVNDNIVDAVIATVKNKQFDGYDALVPSALT